MTTFENITPDRGFGSGLNKYSWSSTSFTIDHKLYIGTFNMNLNYMAVPGYLQQIANAPDPSMVGMDAFRRLRSGSPVTPSTGGEIWRWDGSSWEQVHKASADHVGFRSMTEYNGRIYTFSSRGANGPAPGDSQYKSMPFLAPDNTVTYTGMQVIRSADGTTWEEIPGGPAINPLNAFGRASRIMEGKLWVGTENPISGPEVWSFDDTVGWRLESRLPGIAIGDLIEINGTPYVGTWGSGNGFQLFELGPQTANPLIPRTAADVTPEFADPSIIQGNLGVMKLVEFKGRLALSTVNYTEGFTLLHTDDPSDKNSWTITTTTGFDAEHPSGNATNAYGWDFEVLGDTLYLTPFQINKKGSPIDQFLGFDFSFDGRAQLWATDDLNGFSWEIIEDNGWDSLFTYGGRTMTIWDNRLVVGTASNMLIPDIFSDPYYLPMPDVLIAQLRAQGYNELADWLEPMNLNEMIPYIGTEVFVSTQILVPSTLVLAGIGAGLIGWLRRRKTL